jgi:PAS domain S-box-containing protein
MTAQPIHILLVEDNPADARLIEVLFAQQHEGEVKVDRAQTLAEALAALNTDAEKESFAAPGAVRRPIDLILLDLTLPDSESLETLRAVAERAPDIPVVVMSGMSDENLALQAVRQGAQDYLVKGRIDGQLLHRSVGYAIERRRAQNDRDLALHALQQSEERLRLVTEASTDGIWDWNVATGEVYWSDRVYHLLGVVPDGQGGLDKVLRLVHDDDRSRVEDLLRDALASGTRFSVEFRLRSSDGSYKFIRASGKTVRDPTGAPLRMAGSLTDITARKVAEQALQESERRFLSFMDNSPTIAYMKDISGRYVYLNAGFEKLFHRTAAELTGKTDLELWPPEIAERLRKADAAVLSSDEPMEFTETLPGDDGPHEWLSFKFPIESGGQRSVGGVAVDITERRRAEKALREADEQLRQSQKMEAVGQLASGVAHDFNNLLTAIRGYASLARHTLDEEHPALESLDQVEEASRQAGGVAGALLTFARKGKTEKLPVNVATAVESAARLFRRTLPPNVRLITDVAGAEDLWVLADSTQLQQVVINLGINARDAIGGAEGTLTVAVQPAGQGQRRHMAPRSQPPAVSIIVRDTGAGMTPDIKARIFEPFFTTKPRGMGTGLGLAVIHGIVQDHAGTITVDTAPGKGSTFTVTFPLVPAPTEVKEDETPEPGFIMGGLALLAEHNQLVRGLLASMLSALGYEIAHASSAEQALNVVAGIDLPIDLLVVELDLPGRGGVQLLSDIRAAGQPTRAVIVAGAGTTADTFGPGTVVLRKPFQLADLRRAITTLNQPGVDEAGPAPEAVEDSRAPAAPSIAHPVSPSFSTPQTESNA